MLELLCGSEGSLGLITEATLLLQEKPAQTQGVWIQFDQLSQLFCFWRELSGQADSSPLPSERTAKYYAERPCAEIVAFAAKIAEKYLK